MKFLETFLHDYEAFPVLCGSTLIELAELSFAARSAADRLDLLDRAEALLKAHTEDSQWMARLLALRGRLTIKNHPTEALEQLQRALTINKDLGNNLAAENLEKFITTTDRQTPRGAGDVSGKVLVSLPGLESQPSEGELAQPLPNTTILVEDGWVDSVTIQTILAGESKPITRHVPIDPSSILGDLLAFDTYENYSFVFLKQMANDWITICRELGRILMDEQQVQRLQAFDSEHQQKSALRVIINALQLSSAPWELMVLPSQPDGPASVSPAISFFYRSVAHESGLDILWLQTALSKLGKLGAQSVVADRIYGTRTEAAVKRFQSDQSLPPHGRLDGRTRRAIKRALHEKAGRERPRVMLLQPGIERQRATFRGQEVFGFSLEDWYKREGFKDLVVVQNPHLEQVEGILSDFKPDVVHICPTMEESTSVGIYLDFGSGGTGVMPRRKSSAHQTPSEAVSGEVQFLTLTAVAELMRRQQKQNLARPLLILDVLRPAGQTELFTQLFLRNAFAAQLYQLGAFETIIATGLTPPELQEEVSHILISGIGSFEAVGETVNRLRRMVDAGSYTHLPPVGHYLGPLRDPSDTKFLSNVVATAGTALFTQDPNM